VAGVEATIKGGEGLQRRLAEIAAGLDTAQEVRVGFLEGSTYPDGTSVALVAASHNWGVPGKLPARPFFSQMVDKQQSGWPALIELGLKRSGMNARGALEFAGRIMVEQLQASILAGGFAPLSPKTIARKGFDKALVDTSHMLNSAGSEVT
jgi:hypothetical protein